MLTQNILLSEAAHLKIGVPENYDGIFPWYLTKVSSFFKEDKMSLESLHISGIFSSAYIGYICP